MKLLFVSAAAYAPDRPNGPLLGLLELMTALAARGVEPALLCRDPASSAGRMRRYDRLGVPLFTVDDPALAAPALAAAGEAEVVIAIEGGDTRILAACHELRQPVIAWFVRPIGARAAQPLAPTVRLLAASPRLATSVQAWYGGDVAVLAMAAPRIARASGTSRTRVHAVLFDPRPAGGVELLFRIAAARPRVAFVVAETAPLPDDWRAACFERAARCGNIDWRSGPCDLQGLFTQARLVLTPLLAADADPWAVLAAQAAGVPALATGHPILAEAVGAAGVTVAPEADIAAWLAGFDRLWGDRGVHEGAAAAAARQSDAAAADLVAAALLGLIDPPTTQVA